MKLAGNTITVFNAVHNTETDTDEYRPTVITGTTWHAQVVTKVSDSGLEAASKYVVRVPITADFSGKTYADPVAFAALEDPSTAFTFRPGDIIVRAAVESEMTPAQVKAAYSDCFTILGATDATRAPREPHFYIVGA